MKKALYIELMEKVLEAYSYNDIKTYTQSVIDNHLEEHGYPRLTANLGILIGHGKKTEYKDEFCKMMDLCCEEIPIAKEINGKRVGNDFSVKEIVFCILEIEKAKIFDESVTNRWREMLSKIDPHKTYSCIAEYPPKPIGNWAAFAGVSEQLRKYAGIGDESFFINNQIESQLFAFDENGMYRDPGQPMVYDFVTRLQLATALYFGYDGKCKDALEKELLKSADITLLMQSVTGEIPFGGRSNQFLHNETFYAALCEFYADYFKKKGDLVRAGRFKSAARIAVENIIPRLNEKPITHIKNRFPISSKFGCEDYAYFDKYMVTAGSWLYLAYAMADDDIDEVDCPAICENYIFETSACFHMIMAKFADYFIQFDTNSNFHYDANGIGRIHKKGVYSETCLSVPFTTEPHYVTDIKNSVPLSICAGINTSERLFTTAEEGVDYKLTEKTLCNDYARLAFECKLNNGSVINQICTAKKDGIEFEVFGEGIVEIIIPVFAFDGENKVEKVISENSVSVNYKGHKCTYSTDSKFIDKNEVYANRNGHYNAYSVSGQGNVSINIVIE